MCTPRDRKSLQHLIEAIEFACGYVEGLSFDDFLRDRRTRDAVERRVEIMGEAVRRLSEDFRAEFPDVEWRKIIGMRDITIHNYDHVDVEIVWLITKVRGPALLPRLKQILAALPEDTS